MPYEVALTGPPSKEHEGGFHPESLLIRPSVIQGEFIHPLPGIVPACRESCVAEAPAAMASGLPNLLTSFPPVSLINQSISHIIRTPSSSGSHDHFKPHHFVTRPESNFYSSKIGGRCFHWDKFVRDRGFRRLAGCPNLHSFDFGESFFRSVVERSAFEMTFLKNLIRISADLCS